MEHQLLNCDVGKCMTANLVFKGNITNKDVESTKLLNEINDRIEFVSWVRSGVKVGINKRQNKAISNRLH